MLSSESSKQCKQCHSSRNWCFLLSALSSYGMSVRTPPYRKIGKKWQVENQKLLCLTHKATNRTEAKKNFSGPTTQKHSCQRETVVFVMPEPELRSKVSATGRKSFSSLGRFFEHWWPAKCTAGAVFALIGYWSWRSETCHKKYYLKERKENVEVFFVRDADGQGQKHTPQWDSTSQVFCFPQTHQSENICMLSCIFGSLWNLWWSEQKKSSEW